MVVLKIAWRNIFLHKLKTLIIGAIITFGTLVAVIGNAFVDAISIGMKKSLTASITGDIQIYAKGSKEKLSVLGSPDGNFPDIGHVNDFAHISSVLTNKVPAIKAIVPMGINAAIFNPGNLLDIKLTELRESWLSPTPDPQQQASLQEHVREIIQDIAATLPEHANKLAFLDEDIKQNYPADLNIALSDHFWASFASNFEERLEFLANRIAPLIFDDNMIYFSYIGTAPEKFQAAMPLFEMVQGEPIPPGKRGFLFNEYTYENVIKHRVARRLDQIKSEMESEGRTIKTSKTLADKVQANIDQAAEIYRQLNPTVRQRLTLLLKDELSREGAEIAELMQRFLDMNDQNFSSRYQFFYKEIAPHIILYKVRIGDVFPVTAATKSGFSSALNMKVYGTYRLKSLEGSLIAGSYSIMDLISFRDLYGFVTDERRQESADLEKEMGITDISSDNIDVMFSSAGITDKSADDSPSVDLDAIAMRGEDMQNKREIFTTSYTRAQMEDGIFLNAAIILHDNSKLSKTLADIEKVIADAKLDIQAVDWRSAAGPIGQLTVVVRIVLYVFVGVIFLIAAFIIMNAMLMATMERKKEIGTMRAIGAQRKFLLYLFLYETLILNVIFGALGALLGIVTIYAINYVGIPASGDVAQFLFSGSRLYLPVNAWHMATVMVAINIVAILSTQFPAWRAMQISPLEAMQTNE